MLQYTTMEVVEILLEEFQLNYPKEKITNDKIHYYTKKYNLGKNGFKSFLYTEKDLNQFRIIFNDLTKIHNTGYHAIKNLFTAFDPTMKKGSIYFIVKKYNLGKKYDLSVGAHWLFDAEKINKFLKTYNREEIAHIGRPHKIIIVDKEK